MSEVSGNEAADDDDRDGIEDEEERLVRTKRAFKILALSKPAFLIIRLSFEFVSDSIFVNISQYICKY